MTAIILLLILLQIKHFVCDFPLQIPYMYLNKGKYGHLGGIVHAAVHALGTLFIFGVIFQDADIGIPLALIDFIVHYHIDYAKVKICTKYNLKPDNSEKYWYLLGLDQMLHQLTYIGFIWAI